MLNGRIKMTPEQLDEYLESFGEKVSMRSKSHGRMVPVSKLREYIKTAIKIAEDRIRSEPTTKPIEQDGLF